MTYDGIYEQIAAWEELRLGKFTASEIHRLMVGGRSKSEYFGAGAQTYINEVLAEIVTGQPVGDMEKFKAAEWGDAHELEAVTRFEEITGKKVQYNGGADPVFCPLPGFEEMAGASRDGMIEGEAIIEVKCPYNSTNHVSYLFITDAQSLKDTRKDYYWQVVMNCICNNVDKGYYISYDPRVQNEKLRLHYVEINVPDEDKALLLERIGEAVKTVRMYLGLLDDIN